MGFRTFYEGERGARIAATAERRRLLEPDLVKRWRRWGPYLSDRQWGTVREWYETGGGRNPWTDLVHDHARSRAYRWGEDGIMGISDLQGRLCFSVALWNEADPILKERLFGLSNPEGNHGEDVKEYYFYLDNLPTHAYMKGLYKYPWRYPYAELTERSRSIHPLEYELLDAGAFEEDRYFDVLVEYAKASPEDVLVRITASNRGPEAKTLHLLPTLWFRNTWSWTANPPPIPSLSLEAGAPAGTACILATDPPVTDPLTNRPLEGLGTRRLYCSGSDEVLFTDNDTNRVRLWGVPNESPFVKDGINDHVVSRGAAPTVNPARRGTKAAAWWALALGPGESRTVSLRLADAQLAAPFGAEFEQTFALRRREADEFYDALCPYPREGADARERDLYLVQRQAFAGMLWSKQFYHLVAHRWLEGDRVPPTPEHRSDAKMRPWIHLYAKDVISMPDAWEYPWFAAWDLAFHATTLAIVDPEFARYQLELLVMEWYQHPNGQLPGFEWDFSMVNPPVHAWAAWRVFQTEKEIYGRTDVGFLERVFGKLALNFTWWVNEVDEDKNNVFEGGFLGLDNIRIIDRDPDGRPLEQADGTAWVAMFCLDMLKIASELAEHHGGADAPGAYAYKDAARKYLQHFMYLCDAMNRIARSGLWDEDAGFFMDCARDHGRLQVFSMVGLVPLFAIQEIAQTVTDPETFYDLFGMLRWFARNRHDLVAANAHLNLDELLAQVSRPQAPAELRGHVAIVDREKLARVLSRVLDPDQFLGAHGIRSLSRAHLRQTEVPFAGGRALRVVYEPAESIEMSRMGGNSNWAGPIWMPVNYLMVHALRRFHRSLGAGFTVRHPAPSGPERTLAQVADDLEDRLLRIFLRDPITGARPVFGGAGPFDGDAHWRDLVLFYEYFHGGDAADRFCGTGLGASHQTGWTGLVANLIQERGVRAWAAQHGVAEDDESV